MRSLFARSTKLSTKLLLLTLPAATLTTALVLVALMVAEIRHAENLNRAAAVQLGQRDAKLLSTPLWNLEETALRAMMRSLLSDSRVRCIRLRDDTRENFRIEYGDCAALHSEIWIATPIRHEYGGGESIRIGEVAHLVDVSPDTDAMTKEIGSRLLLIALLVVVLIACFGIGFRMLVLAPLGRISDSLRHFDATGKRRPVDWSAGDELGRFILEYNRSLERQEQAELEMLAAKEAAERALADLRQAQQTLVQSEKLAALGSLVAGIAHEINTPVGSSLTVASSLLERALEMQTLVEGGRVRKSDLTGFIASMREAGDLLVASLNAAAGQIQNFKQVAVDQASSQRRAFNLKVVAEEVLSTLKPHIKHTAHRLDVDIPDDIVMDSYPGPLGQVISNCFINAVTHGFDGIDTGVLRVEARLTDPAHVRMDISDNGRGIRPEHLGKIFDPFFTTRMGRGGTGLGLNLVYTIVTGMLGGTIEVHSTPGAGTRMCFLLPLAAPTESQSTARG